MKGSNFSLKNLYKKHVFICVNKREDSNKKSCGEDGVLLRENLKKSILKLKLNKDIRINKSGCLGKCGVGPCLVIYPESKWYYNLNSKDDKKVLDYLLKEKS